MKKLIIALLLIASTAFAAGQLEYNANGTYPIQGFAPDGRYAAILTAYSTWFDMTNYAAFQICPTADSKIRMATTQSKTGTVSETVFGGACQTFVTSATPFINISGAGLLRRSTPKP